MRQTTPILLASVLVLAAPASASIVIYGTEDCLTTGCYGASDPTAGATLQGLSAGSVTSATNGFGHLYPFVPTVGDLPGTDQIYVGSTQTGAHDGYSTSSQAIPGPLILSLDYSSQVGAGQTVDTLTLGLALDDFQFPSTGNPFTATVDGVLNTTITNFLNSTDLGGPTVQFFTFGLDPSLDNANHILTISIDEGGDGGDGYAVDFASVGVTTTNASVPEPSTAGTILVGLALLALPRTIFRR